MDAERLRRADCDVREEASLSDYTTFRLGGPCPFLVSCSTPDQLAAAVKELVGAGKDFVLIGGGSNLLVADEGVDSAVIRYWSDDSLVKDDGGVLEVSGAMPLDDLIVFSVEQGLDGLVYASGIPGTVGGAIAGNAGAFGEQIGDHIESVVLMDRKGQVCRRGPEELNFSYRSSLLHEGGEIVVSARIRVRPGDAEALAKRRDEILELRREKHPDWHVVRTAGSFFRNIEPTSAAERRQAAGYFLERAGAKGMRVGGARVFEKHANIIVAEEG